MQITCDYCKATVHRCASHVKRTANHFCNYQCFRLWERGVNNPNWRGVSQTCKCLHCGKEVLVQANKRKKGGIFCSPKCHAQGKYNPAWKRIEIACDFCGANMERAPSHIHGTNFCSKPCQNEYQSHRMRGTGNLNWRHGKEARRYGSDWRLALKKKIRKRDNYTCQSCFTKQLDDAVMQHHVHHIDFDRNNNSPENLITLCVLCHIRGHKKGIFNFARSSGQKD